MQLKSIETFANTQICFVRVTDSDGSQGWGMTAPFAANITAQVLHQITSGTALKPFEDFTAVPDVPGWGFEPSAEFLATSQYAVSK